MKYLIYIPFILFLLLSTGLQAQKPITEAADLAFNEKKYSIAVEKYKKAYSKLKKNKDEKNRVRFQMAECYRLMNNMKRAEATYKGLVKSNYFREKPVVLLHYANSLKANMNYDEAILEFEEYIKIKPDDPRGQEGLKSCKLAKEWMETPSNYQVTAVKDLNSREDDFAPCFSSDQYNSLIFTSNREGSLGKNADEWTGYNFTDLFQSRVDKKDKWSTPDLIENQEVINTVTNEGTSTMNSAFNTLYFSRCGNDKNKESGCHIYAVKRTGRNYEAPKILNLGGDSASVIVHPTLSEDELTIYFAADFDGGQGGMDIWYATRKSKSDDFERPKNAGTSINTAENELFPYLRYDTVLYFASAGHINIGGLDIFRIAKKGDEWGTAINMGMPINSYADDFGIIFHPEEFEQGYFSTSRKEGGKGRDDIWSFYKAPLLFTLSGVVKDDRTLQYIEGAEVKMVGSDGSSLVVRTNSVGRYEFTNKQFLPKTTYELTIIKEEYFTQTATETTVGVDRSKDFVRNFMLTPIPKKPIVLPEILYDLAKWDLKPQYQDSLQGLIKTLNDNPTIVVELASHTDARDTDERNDILSQKRAQSVVDYLILRGIDPDRTVAKGYGERVPRVMDKDYVYNGEVIFKEGVVLTETYIDSLKNNEIKEVAHQLNRRTEFSVLRNDFVPKDKIENVESPLIDIVIDPLAETSSVKYTAGKEGQFTLVAEVNRYPVEITVDKTKNQPQISLKSALKLLRDGAISKTDFKGDPNVVLAEGSITDNAVFTIAEIKILKHTITNIDVTVSYKIEDGFTVDEATFTKFGKYALDPNTSTVIFEQ